LELTPQLAVEKCLYRLALHHAGAVTIARAFLELPLSLEEVEEYADAVSDGRSVVRNEWSEHLTYEFPELVRQMPNAPDDCPLCFGPRPPACTEGGEDQRRSHVCDECYKTLKRLHQTQPNATVMGKLAHFFRGEEEEENLVEVALLEHEIFYVGLRAGIKDFTHTTIAAQSRRPAHQIKERLDRMAARRYIQVGLLETGDAVAYTFPPDLTYPRKHYERLEPPKRPSSRLTDQVTLEVTPDAEPEVKPFKPLPKVSAKPKKPPLKITIKSRRDRPTT
jgi:hypothetical protein